MEKQTKNMDLGDIETLGLYPKSAPLNRWSISRISFVIRSWERKRFAHHHLGAVWR